MRQCTRIDNSLMERRSLLELIGRLKRDSVTLKEMEQIGQTLRQAGRRALRPLLRELWRENSGELITRYVYILDFFETESWLDQLIQVAIKRRDLGRDGKAALLVALEGYGVDVHASPFREELASLRPHLSQGVPGGGRLGEDGIVSFLDDFLSYPQDVQQSVIRELPKSCDLQGARLLEALLWHDEPAIVLAALAALGKIRDPLAAGALHRYLQDGAPDFLGEARKSLRRLSFVGVQPPALPAALPFHAGYVTAPDGEGYRSLLVSRWVGEGSLAVLYMQVHERRGLLAAWGAASLTESEFLSELEGFSVQDDLHQVPPHYVLALVRDALYWSKELCYLPADFYMRRGMFAGFDLSPLPYRPAFPEGKPQRNLSWGEGEAISRELFEEEFFTGWFLASPRVYEFAEEYRSAEDGEPALQRFCEEFFAPNLAMIRDRLLLCGDLMRQCGSKPDLVAKVVSIAASLEGNPLPHHLHPFLRAFALESMEVAREAMAQGDCRSSQVAGER